MEKDLIDKYFEQSKLKQLAKINRVHKYKSVYLVIGLQSNIVRCRFGKDVLIRKAKKEELERFQNDIKFNLSEDKLVVEFYYQSTAPDSYKSIYDFSERINFLFNLVSDSKICLPKSINYIQDFYSESYTSAGVYTDNKIREFTSNLVLFERNQILQVKNIWKKFVHADHSKNKAYHIAWTRYLFTQTKYNFEEKIIDCMIAFEALFLKADENEGAAYKLALRVTYFLREDFDKNQLFDYMKKSYNLRSKVVHGSNVKENVIKFNDKSLEIQFVVEELISILESAFKKYIFTFYKLPINDFIDEIDKGILSSFEKK